MSYYISRLVEASEREAAGLTKESARQSDDARERLTPLEVRLARLLATIPTAVLHEGISLPALQSRLKGRQRGACHPGELGSALRKAGFARRRKWSNEDGFLTLWYPLKIAGGRGS